jgi:hypothetical protein
MRGPAIALRANIWTFTGARAPISTVQCGSIRANGPDREQRAPRRA